MNHLPTALQVMACAGQKVYVYLDDGSVHLYDASPLIEKGGVFAPLRDDVIFMSRATVMNGTLAWDLSGTRDDTKCLDVDPISIANAPKVKDPLAEAS